MITDSQRREFGLHASQRLADGLDSMAIAAVAGLVGDFDVWAVGSWGRREACGISGADVFFRCDDQRPFVIRDIAERFRSAGVRLCWYQPKGEFEDVCRALEARHVVGPLRLAPKPPATTVNHFVACLLSSRRQAIEAAPTSIRDGSGGLRDWHVIKWAGQFARIDVGPVPPSVEDLMVIRALCRSDDLTEAPSMAAEPLGVSVPELIDHIAECRRINRKRAVAFLEALAA